MRFAFLQFNSIDPKWIHRYLFASHSHLFVYLPFCYTYHFLDQVTCVSNSRQFDKVHFAHLDTLNSIRRMLHRKYIFQDCCNCMSRARSRAPPIFPHHSTVCNSILSLEQVSILAEQKRNATRSKYMKINNIKLKYRMKWNGCVISWDERERIKREKCYAVISFGSRWVGCNPRIPIACNWEWDSLSLYIHESALKWNTMKYC